MLWTLKTSFQRGETSQHRHNLLYLEVWIIFLYPKVHNWVDILNSHEDHEDAEEIEDDFVITETNEGTKNL